MIAAVNLVSTAFGGYICSVLAPSVKGRLPLNAASPKLQVEANRARCDKALLGGDGFGPARRCTRPEHGQLVARLRGQRHQASNGTGYGVYLGKGLVITAAHVVGWASRTKPSVRIAGLDLPAQAIKEGSTHWGVDLTLLSIDEHKLPVSLRIRRMLRDIAMDRAAGHRRNSRRHSALADLSPHFASR